MQTVLSNARRIAAFVFVVLGATGCGCDTWGCVEGLNVQLESNPVGGYQIELFVAGTPIPARSGGTCGGATTCAGVAEFNTQARDNVTVRVTTNAGTRTTVLSRITYADGRKDNCHDCQGYAQVKAQIP